MKVSEAAKLWLEYHKCHSKENSIRLADRLKEYVRQKRTQSHERIFPICYEAAREMVANAGVMVGIHLRPHDLRRHAATYASRSGVPIEIISKVILRHSNLSTTERSLGKISDTDIGNVVALQADPFVFFRITEITGKFH